MVSCVTEHVYIQSEQHQPESRFPHTSTQSSLRNTEELEVLLLEYRNSIPDALSEDSLEVGTVGGVGVARREIRLADVGDGSGWIVEDGRPLLNLFKEVLRGDC